MSVAEEMPVADLLAEYIQRTGDKLSVVALTEWDHCRHGEALGKRGCGFNATYDIVGNANCDAHTEEFLLPLVAPLREVERLIPLARRVGLHVVPSEVGFDSMRQCLVRECHLVPAYVVEDGQMCLDHTIEVLLELVG